MSEQKAVSARKDTPASGLAGLVPNLRYDVLSGFLVFLIALPLCLGIATASGFPPIAGVLTAVLGGLITPWISNSELTIKGPAAGMIVVVFGTMEAFGYNADLGLTDPQNIAAYRMVLAITVIAGAIQILFGLFKAGIALSEFFPTAAIHGLLASIGIIIMSTQIHRVLGVKAAAKKPLPLIAEIPNSIQHMNPHIATIGLVSLALLFGLPMLAKKLAVLKSLLKIVPVQVIVLVFAIPAAQYFHLEDEPVYYAKEKISRSEPEEKGKEKPVKVKSEILVPLPEQISNAIVFPDFGGITKVEGWPLKSIKWVIFFALVGTLESLLSAKAIDLLDPWQRKTSFDRDILGVGVANTVSAAVGGLPMISEILRSSANINNGARTRFANMFHGLFLLLMVLLLPGLIKMIPMAALGAMLVFAGFRLASPKEFVHMYKVGPEQLLIFSATIIGVLAEGLLEGVAIGVAVKFALHLFNGAPTRSMFKPSVQVDDSDPKSMRVRVADAAIFSNWIPLKKRLTGFDHGRKLIIDLSDTRLVDHTVMSKLDELRRDIEQQNGSVEIVGLDEHTAVSDHPQAARKKKAK